MASIGGSSVISVRGNMDDGVGENLEDITRAHVDGIAFRKVGKRGVKTSISTVVDCSSPSSTYAAYEALQGTLVTIVDDAGVSHTNIAVHSVVRTGVKKVLTPVGGIAGGSWLLTCQWVVQPTETS